MSIFEKAVQASMAYPARRVRIVLADGTGLIGVVTTCVAGRQPNFGEGKFVFMTDGLYVEVHVSNVTAFDDADGLKAN